MGVLFTRQQPLTAKAYSESGLRHNNWHNNRSYDRGRKVFGFLNKESPVADLHVSRPVLQVHDAGIPQKNDWYRLLSDHWVSSALSLKGGVYIGARALLDINLIWVWHYRSPIPVGRRGVCSRSNDFYLPLLAWGGGGSALSGTS